jgi:hypothetical protein
MRRLACRAVFAAALCAAAGAQAAPVVFFGLDNANLSGGGPHPNADAAQAGFAAAAGPLAQQSFERAGEGIPAGAVPASFAVGARTVSFAGAATDYSQVTNGLGTFTTFATHGSQHLEALTDPGTTYFTMDFDQPVGALGFYLTDVNDWLGTTPPTFSLQIHLVRDGGTEVLDLMQGIPPSQVSDGNVAFWGVVDAADPIRGFFITNPAGNPAEDALGLDQLMLAQPGGVVPAPAPWLLLAALPLAAAATRRRRTD